jgi:hypothetical protein
MSLYGGGQGIGACPGELVLRQGNPSPVYALWASGVIAGRRGDAKFVQDLTGFYIKAAREALK